MNHVVLIGRLTKEPELRYIPGNGKAVTTITLAVDRYSKEKETDFIPVVIWGKQAENTANYMRKGSQMAVAGRIQTRSYETKNGEKRYITEVVANEVTFLSREKKKEPDLQGIKDTFGSAFDEGIEPTDDGDIPF